MSPKLFKLPTEAVDNSVGNRILRALNNGFYYSFVNLNSFKTVINFSLYSIGY